MTARRWDHLSDADMRAWVRDLKATAAVTRRHADELEQRADRVLAELLARGSHNLASDPSDAKTAATIPSDAAAKSGAPAVYPSTSATGAPDDTILRSSVEDQR